MDLSTLGKKAIFIPTPGQTEQEYLAERLADQNVIVKQNQSSIDFERGLQEVEVTTDLLKKGITIY